VKATCLFLESLPRAFRPSSQLDTSAFTVENARLQGQGVKLSFPIFLLLLLHEGTEAVTRESPILVVSIVGTESVRPWESA